MSFFISLWFLYFWWFLYLCLIYMVSFVFISLSFLMYFACMYFFISFIIYFFISLFMYVLFIMCHLFLYLFIYYLYICIYVFVYLFICFLLGGFHYLFVSVFLSVSETAFIYITLFLTSFKQIGESKAPEPLSIEFSKCFLNTCWINMPRNRDNSVWTHGGYCRTPAAKYQTSAANLYIYIYIYIYVYMYTNPQMARGSESRPFLFAKPLRKRRPNMAWNRTA